jgi:hypothetical protein
MTSEFKQCNGCTRETNNANFNCPVKGDYRLFTDWRPRCSTQYYDMITNQLPSSLDYRMYLTHNASDIMQGNALSAYMKSSCGPCVDNPSWNDGTMLKQFDSQQCNTRTCTFKVSDPWGLGRERQYYDDDMGKKMRAKFIQEKEKENELFKKTSECCGTKEDNLAYYPIDGGVQEDYARYSVPSGGTLMRGGDRLKASQ